jgi:ferritin-like metal-binding protein YciE
METEHQIDRLEQAFRMIGQEPQGTKCYGIHGILSEGDDLLGNIAGKKLLNAAVIASAQAVEHYEITRYSALVAWAPRWAARTSR